MASVSLEEAWHKHPLDLLWLHYLGIPERQEPHAQVLSQFPQLAHASTHAVQTHPPTCMSFSMCSAARVRLKMATCSLPTSSASGSTAASSVALLVLLVGAAADAAPQPASEGVREGRVGTVRHAAGHTCTLELKT